MHNFFDQMEVYQQSTKPVFKYEILIMNIIMCNGQRENLQIMDKYYLSAVKFSVNNILTLYSFFRS
jgi:hypothetical protein